MRKLFNFLTLALMLFTAMGAYAIPARRVVSQYTQPDGSTISLRLVGDEFSHYYLTDDDQMVIAGNDGYYFATLNAQGLAVASDVLATAPAKRTAEARRLLASVKKEDLVKGMAKVRTRNVAARPNNSMKAPAKAAASNWPSGIGLFPNNTYPTTGSPDAVIILVQFPDQKFTLPDPKAYFTGFASKEGFSESGLVGGTNPDYNAHGSALDYFKASSNGQFTPNFHVLGPVTLPNNMAYYGGNDVYGDDKNPHLMVLTPCRLWMPLPTSQSLTPTMTATSTTSTSFTPDKAKPTAAPLTPFGPTHGRYIAAPVNITASMAKSSTPTLAQPKFSLNPDLLHLLTASARSATSFPT